MFTSTINTTVSGGLAANFQSAVTIQAGQRIELNEPVPAAATTVMNAPIDTAGTKLLCLLATGVPLTVKTNDASMPDNEFVLQPGIPFVWPRSPEEALKDSYGVAIANPIATLHVLNASPETAGSLRVAALVDPTP